MVAGSDSPFGVNFHVFIICYCTDKDSLKNIETPRLLSCQPRVTMASCFV